MTALAIFARAPRPGRTKTRLIEALGPEGAAALYEAFLRDTLANVARLTGFAPTIWAADETEPLRAISPYPVVAQPEGDLGARMSAAIAHGLATHGRAIVIGTDAPTLPAKVIDAAARALDGADVVLGPAVDGGYYLIGARVPVAFDGAIRWSSRFALADTKRALGERRIAFTPPWFDVDTAHDLALLRLQLGVEPRLAPHTAAALRRF